MSRHCWLFISALIGLLLAAQAHAQTIGGDTRSKPSTSQTQTKPGPVAPPTLPATVQDNIGRIARALEAANNNHLPKESEQRAERDVRAQEYMASWVPKMFWLSVIEIALTCLGIFLVWQTFHQTRRAAKAAEDAVIVTRAIGQAQTICYPRTEIQVLRMHPGTNPPWRPNILTTIVNAGLSPADELNIEARWKIIQNGETIFDGESTSPEMEGLRTVGGNGGTERIDLALEKPIDSSIADAIGRGVATWLIDINLNYSTIYGPATLPFRYRSNLVNKVHNGLEVRLARVHPGSDAGDNAPSALAGPPA